MRWEVDDGQEQDFRPNGLTWTHRHSHHSFTAHSTIADHILPSASGLWTRVLGGDGEYTAEKVGGEIHHGTWRDSNLLDVSSHCPRLFHRATYIIDATSQSHAPISGTNIDATTMKYTRSGPILEANLKSLHAVASWGLLPDLSENYHHVQQLKLRRGVDNA